MVKVVEGGVWRGCALFALLGTATIANACGGRTVWVEEGADSGESGGASGRGGDNGGGYAGDYGGGGYTGGYGGDYGGTYGGTYGGAGYTGGVSGAYGGGVTGGYGGTYGGGGFTGGYGGTYGGVGVTGGVAGKGGFGGSFGGSAGVTGKGGCGAASGSGGSSGSPALGKACSLFCTRFPYSSCSTAFAGPADCISQCRAGFGFGSRCQAPLADFLMCAGQALDPNAQCYDEGIDVCAGPGCLSDAELSCPFEYSALANCELTPTPPPPCPPPNRPVPPECGQSLSWDSGFCSRETFCASGVNTAVDCSYLYDSGNAWACQCSTNGSAIGSLTTSGTTGDACLEAAAICGVY